MTTTAIQVRLAAEDALRIVRDALARTAGSGSWTALGGAPMTLLHANDYIIRATLKDLKSNHRNTYQIGE